jgi:nicotinamide-nucleotide amidase
VFASDLVEDARGLLDLLRTRKLLLATAESCTGGLIAGLLTEIPGSSDVFERGFVSYSNTAKRELLGVPEAVLARHGAVSREAALAMAAGALSHSKATVAIAVTGVAGPGGGSAEKPVGLVHLAASVRGGETLHRECRFGNVGRGRVRIESVRVALGLVRAVVAKA